MRGEPRYGQPPQQPGGYYAQETQAYQPQANPQHYAPQAYQPQGQGHYLERNGPRGYVGSSAEPQDGYFMTEPRGYNQGPGPAYGQDDGANADDEKQTPYGQNPEWDRYQLEDRSQKSTARDDPSPPKEEFDYVSHNKFNYGRTPKRTYRLIHDVKKEGEEKLTHIFIQPKVKGKGQKESRDASPTRYPAIAESPAEMGPAEMGPAESGQGSEEVLWAQRSASLAHAKNAKVRVSVVILVIHSEKYRQVALISETPSSRKGCQVAGLVVASYRPRREGCNPCLPPLDCYFNWPELGHLLRHSLDSNIKLNWNFCTLLVC